MTQSAKKRTCARCGYHGYPAASFPEGHLCWRCLTAALAAAGTCPGCGADGRVLPGLRDGIRICRDCAGITREFCCLRCGTETGMTGRRRGPSRLCGPCSVTWTAARLLDDGTGAIAAPLKPLAEALAAAPSPAAMLEWLDQPHIRDLLMAPAAGKLALTHEALDAWPRPRAVFYLRDLLVSCGVLPAADKQLREFQAWLDRCLDSLAGHPHLRLLRQFGLWHQLPRMRARAAAGPLRTTAAQYARSRFIQAQTFPDLDRGPRRPAVRPHPGPYRRLPCPPRHPPAGGRPGVPGLGCRARHIPGHLDIPSQQPYAGQVITQQRRLDLLRRFATDTAIPVRPRAAACLMLLYASRSAASCGSPPPACPSTTTARPGCDSATRPAPSRRRSARYCTSSPPPATTTCPPTTAATGFSLAATRASPPPTVPWPPSFATTACRCAPPASQPCASSSSRSPPPSSPTPSASTTPPPLASTSRQADRGASTPTATTRAEHAS